MIELLYLRVATELLYKKVLVYEIRKGGLLVISVALTLLIKTLPRVPELLRLLGFGKCESQDTERRDRRGRNLSLGSRV